MQEYLSPTEFLDFESEAIKEFAIEKTSGAGSEIEQAVALYYAVRDGFSYNPYKLDLRPEHLKASILVKRKDGNCIEKSIILAASARALGIPSRLSFYIVTNHIATERVERILGTRNLVFHGAAEMFLEGKWVKSTPAFNRQLCDVLGVAALEFNGREDSMFQEYDHAGRVFMQYLHEYGNFPDLPYEKMLGEFIKHYPRVFELIKDSESPLFCDLRSFEEVKS
jgi:transglutaminase-like putative cysteine protease